MSLNLDKSRWVRVALGDVTIASKEKCDPRDGSVERYVAGEHMDTDDLKIHRWGDVGEVDLGPAFHRRFRPGQVLYGSRRTYLRKVAVAEFDGVCANTTFVVEAKDDSRLLQAFLPFVMTSESFHAFAIAESKGSVNPYVNWSGIERYEFDLPPLEEQQRLADLLWAIERHSRRLAERTEATSLVRTELLSFTDIMCQSDEPWEEVPFETAIEFREGPGIMARDFRDDGVPLIRLAGMVPGSHLLDGCNHLDPLMVAKKWSQFRVEAGDVLLSTSATLGRVAVVDERASGAIPYTGIIRMRPCTDRLDPRYLPWVLRSTHFMEQVTAAGVGSVMAHFGPSHLRKMTVLLPPLVEQTRLIDLFERFDSERASESGETVELGRVRQSLLHAISGSN